MFKTKIIAVAIVLLIGFNVLAQKAYVSFEDRWVNLLTQDDNEKKFRFSELLESLHAIVDTIGPDSANAYWPSGWTYASNETHTMAVMAGILPFDSEPDRLIWMVVPTNDSISPRVFTSQLSSSAVGMQKPFLRLKDYELSSSPFVSMEVLVGNNIVFELPDIHSKIILGDLVESTRDEDKLKLSRQLWKRMALLLGYQPFFNQDFSGYEKISTLLSSDGLLKIVTWNVALANGTNTFVGGIALNQNGKLEVFDLIDKYTSINNPEQASLSPSRWYGAVYYELIENRYKRNTYYTLLGFNPNNAFSKIRVIDVLTITSGGKLNFGNAIFETVGRQRRRKVFEYSARASMMLRYDAGESMIVMDNLAPMDPVFQNNFSYYGPDFTHNGFKFEKGNWVYYSDIELRNPATQRRSQ